MKLAATVLSAAFLAAGAGFYVASQTTPVATAVPAPAAAGEFAVDAVHSSVVFKVKHMNVAWFYGRFNKVEGSFNLDSANPSASSINVTVPTDSVDTANGGRDKHLRNQDFFSSTEFPTLTFKSTSVEKTGENTYKVKGDLTARGTTKQVEVTVEDTGRGKGRDGSDLAGMHTTFTINRSDFGIKYGAGALGEEVTLMVSLEGKK